MQSCAVSSSVSLMFQKGSGVERKSVRTVTCFKKKEGKKGKLNAEAKSLSVSLGARF